MTLSPNNKGAKNFQDLQYQFTRHLRDPNSTPPKGIEQRRINIYKELVYNGIEKFIATSFPVLRKITNDDDWHHMLRDYICHHQAHTPLFPKMPLEFLQYLECAHHTHSEYPDYILELATYEWAEICVTLDVKEINMNGVDAEGDLLARVPVLNPIIMPQTYNYPVHHISPDYLPDGKSEKPFYLLVYRRRNDEVGFMELNSVSARLIECMQGNKNKTGLQLLQNIAEELKHPNPQVVIEGGHEIMHRMHYNDIILGVHACT